MGKEFEVVSEIQVAATPEQVWEAIATGPGVDSWFMGRNDIEPREGGKAQCSVDDYFTMESTVTAWEPPNRYATRSEPGEDGSFHAFEYLVEARDQGSTVVRLVHSGFLGQDDWEWEYDALSKGDPMYVGTLREYLTHFLGRIGTPVSAWGPQQPDEDTVWSALSRAIGTVTPGSPVSFPFAGTTISGVIDSALYPGFIGVRTEDALYRFVGGQGAVGVGHHIFASVDRAQASKDWQAWLTDLFS